MSRTNNMKIGLCAIGLNTYWDQLEGLLDIQSTAGLDPESLQEMAECVEIC